MIEIKDKSKCCGCTACASICPKNAIEMKPDEEGFLYPVVYKGKCVNCGLCEKVCPYNKNTEKNTFRRCYAIQNKNEDILNTSTSGGFFSSLSEYVIKNAGYVCGAQFDENLKVVHKIVSTEEEIKKFRESKYVQSDLNGIFINVKKKLDEGKIVCFSGTPCQVVGLKSYLKKEYENLITVDFVCRSVPSPLLFEKYKEYQEKKYKSKIKEIHFRKKTYGYHSGTMKITFENGKEYYGSNRVDLYNKSFHSDKCSRLSCYNCVGKGIDRVSDFTVFDSWFPEKLNEKIKDNDKGFSNLFIHTEKANNIFEKNISKDFNYYLIDAEKASSFTGGMMQESIKEKEARKNFYKNINKGNFEEEILKMVNISLFDKAFEKSKKILYKSGILKVIKKLKSR